MSLIKLDIIVLLTVLLVLTFTDADAQEGFYLQAGIGENHSAWNEEYSWEDNGELGCGFGFGYMKPVSQQLMIDLAFRHKSQCMSGPPVNSDNESGAEFYYIDLYWFPFN